jgi:tetratricopeptide (TPR) repeat protein
MSRSADPRLADATSLRQAGRDEEARLLLLQLHEERPDDPLVNLQCAWVHDKLGLESEAVPFYEQALRLGLDGGDLHDGLLGLGSTYRALGEYESARSTLRRAVAEFPSDRALQTFLAMALYNTGEAKEACEILLRIVAETSADPELSAYREALSRYSEDLDRTW